MKANIVISRKGVNNYPEFLLTDINNTFMVPFFPTLYNISFLCVVSSWDLKDKTPKEIELIIKDPDNQIISQGSLGTLTPNDSSYSQTISADIDGLVISKEGWYEFLLYVGGEEVGSSFISFIKKGQTFLDEYKD